LVVEAAGIHWEKEKKIILEWTQGMPRDTALRLVRHFGGDVQSWMNLQSAYEIKIAGKELDEDRGGGKTDGGLSTLYDR
jgi:plasmid maintenance system antidote protein VapI